MDTTEIKTEIKESREENADYVQPYVETEEQPLKNRLRKRKILPNLKFTTTTPEIKTEITEANMNNVSTFKQIEDQMGGKLSRHKKYKKEPSESDLESKFACELCFKTFDSAHAKKCHSYYHTHYNKKSKTWLNLVKDLSQVDTRTDKSVCHMCSTCHKLMNDSSGFHLCKNDGNGLFVCNTCCKRFHHKKLLEKHLNSHKESNSSEEISHTCQSCSQTFRKKTPFMKHKCGEVLTCDQCGKMFMSQASLDVHLSTHSGETPYTCQKCSRKFRIPGHLVMHCRRTHNIEIIVDTGFFDASFKY